MKKKIVIRLLISNDKSRSKALKIAVNMRGIESAAITGDSRDHVEVIGHSIDPVNLTRQLRKRMGYAELVSVGDADEQLPSDTEMQPEEVTVVRPYGGFVPYYYYEDRRPYWESSCTIL